MVSKITSNDGIDNPHHHHQQIVIGDLLLHSETKIVVIQVLIQSSTSIPPTNFNAPIIHRLLPANSSGTNNSSSTIISCDLKNTSPVNSSHSRSKTLSSSKKLRRMRKAGLALVKELKTKVVAPNYTTEKTVTVDPSHDDDEQTHL